MQNESQRYIGLTKNVHQYTGGVLIPFAPPSSEVRQGSIERPFLEVPFPDTKETKVQIVRFSDEARKKLEKRDRVIYELTGQPTKSLIESLPFDTIWQTNPREYKHMEYFLALPSLRSEIAFRRMNPFLKGVAKYPWLVNREERMYSE